MGKLKALIIVVICLIVSLIFGEFLIQNQHDILVDLLYKNQLVEMSVGRFALGFFVSGLLFGLLLCFIICVILALEATAARTEARKLASQLEKLRERSLKDPT